MFRKTCVFRFLIINQTVRIMPENVDLNQNATFDDSLCLCVFYYCRTY